ncbi:hypothetical protein EJB05_29789, partial [Eragrostis curvula]
MWLHPSPLLLPPRICHHTTPASFKCPGSTLGMKPLSCEYNRAKRGHISSKLGVRTIMTPSSGGECRKL